MNAYVATFHTHLSAMRTHRALKAMGIDARLAPVPRSLSASCGTCVRYQAVDPLQDCLDHDFEKVVALRPDGTYQLLLENE